MKIFVIGLIAASILGALRVQAGDGVILINQSMVSAAGGFPFKITQPGNYRLSGNLNVTGSFNGIHVDISNVTLDLNGFSILCSGGQTAGIGISTDAPNAAPGPTYTNLKLRHGTITGCASAVSVAGQIDYVDVEDLTASGYQLVGLYLGRGAVRHSVITGGNGSGGTVGIVLQSGFIEGNAIEGDAFGISGGSNLIISGNIIVTYAGGVLESAGGQNGSLLINNSYDGPGGFNGTLTSNNVCNILPCDQR